MNSHASLSIETTVFYNEMKSIFDFIFYPVLIGSNFVLRFNAHLINLYKICLYLFVLFCFECCGLKQT